jgi:release factor glutamine methyltransferase
VTLSEAARTLAAVSDTPDLDARLLWAKANDDADVFARLIARRLAHEPVAYMTNFRGFWTIDVFVGPGVLIPRPDSETLIEAAIAHFGALGPKRILDLGTGPGTLLLAALDHWPQATGLGVDASDVALDYAIANEELLGIGSRVEWRTGDWAKGIEEHFDLVFCNPPYVESNAILAPDVVDFEPHAALFAGPDGLDAYRVLIPQLPNVLASDGIVCLEIGWNQRDAVTALCLEQGFTVDCRPDLAGRDRCLILHLK